MVFETIIQIDETSSQSFVFIHFKRDLKLPDCHNDFWSWFIADNNFVRKPKRMDKVVIFEGDLRLLNVMDGPLNT